MLALLTDEHISHVVAEQVARIYLDEAFQDNFKSADVLVLGCTHYPLLKSLLRRVAPAHVTIVDSAESTAGVVGELLRVTPVSTSTEDERRRLPRMKFFATDSVEKFRSLGMRFLGHAIEDVRHVNLEE